MLESFNYFFGLIFTFEAILKITGFGIAAYFADGWNVFDFLIVIVAWFGFIVSRVSRINLGSIAYIIRIFRLGRVIKLVKKAKNLKKVIDTLIFALPALINLGGLLALFLFMFSIFGVSLFGDIYLDDDLIHSKANFMSFNVAFLTLFRAATGEAWNAVM